MRTIILCAALLASCGRDISAEQWNEAARLCEPHGGIATFDGAVTEKWAVADCQDGTHVTRHLRP